MKKKLALILVAIMSIFSIINIGANEVYADFDDVVLDDFDTD